MRILIVEDEVSNRLLLQRYLRGLHPVDVVVNGQEALEAFRVAHKDGDPYRLILLDIQMPVMDGLEALRAIREMEKTLLVPSGHEAKVLMITAHNDKDSVVNAFFSGNASGYLVKPVERETLLDCVAGFEQA